MIGCTNALQEGRRTRVLRALEWGPAVRAGRYSYSLYLMHAPILALFYLVAVQLGLPMATFQLFILFVALPLTVAACYGFYRVFERPLLVKPKSVAVSTAAATTK